tara:strand:+ start:252 stop:500 length:249 start_codon:yes stop_codon:yes gene_type:complete
MKNQKTNKKREHNAPLFKTCVSIDTNGQLVIDHEWIEPKNLMDAMAIYKDDYYKHILSAIIKHCKSESVFFDDKLNKLLRQM